MKTKYLETGEPVYSADEVELELAKLRAEKHFLDMTKEEQEKQNHYDLREMALYYGSWDELRKVISQLEGNDNEAAYERPYVGEAWSGGIAENH
jgi:hypothetical protein